MSQFRRLGEKAHRRPAVHRVTNPIYTPLCAFNPPIENVTLISGLTAHGHDFFLFLNDSLQ